MKPQFQLFIVPNWAQNKSKSDIIFAKFCIHFSRKFFRKTIFCISRNFAKLATLIRMFIDCNFKKKLFSSKCSARNVQLKMFSSKCSAQNVQLKMFWTNWAEHFEQNILSRTSWAEHFEQNNLSRENLFLKLQVLGIH